MRIDIERLIDAEIEEMDAENSYYHFGKRKFDWYPDYDKRKEVFAMRYHDLTHARWQITAIMEVLRANREWKNLYIMSRAVKKWRERNEYKLIPQGMQDQIGKFIFGEEYGT